MATPIYFFWNASTNPDDVIATGIGTCGRRISQFPMTTGIFGVIQADSQQARAVADSLHPSLMTMPGPNGSLKDKHVAHITKEFPKAKSGDSHHTILDAVYALYNDEHLNSNNF